MKVTTHILKDLVTQVNDLAHSKTLLNRSLEEEVRACRRRILEMARGCENPDRVYQVNIQMFPLTKPYQGNKP